MSLTITPAEIVAKAEASGAPDLLAKAEHWDRVPLGEVATVVNGAAFPSAGFNLDGRGMPLVRIRDVGAKSSTTWFEGPWEKKHLVKHDDILIGMDGDFRVARWEGDDALLNQRVCRIDVDEDHYLASFLALVLQGYLDAIWAETSSITVKHLSSRSVAAIPLPAPPIEEQRRIVNLLEDHLSRLDAAKSYLSASRRRLDALERSALDAHFGGREVPLADLIEDISAGKSFGGANAPARDDEWGIIKVSAMTWGEFDPTENKAVASAERVDPRFEIREGDLLVSRANTSEYVGASVLVRHVRPKLLLSDKSLRVTPRPGVESEWLWRALQAPSARRQISALATGTKDSMRNISQAGLKRVLLPNVSSDEQATSLKSFNEVADAVVLLRREVATGARRLEALRRSLLAAAFSGRLTGAASEPRHAEEMINA